MGSGCTDARIVARGEELEFGVARGERWSIRNGDEEGSEHGFFRVECHSVFGIMVVRSALGCVRVGRLHAVDPRPSHLQLRKLLGLLCQFDACDFQKRNTITVN